MGENGTKSTIQKKENYISIRNLKNYGIPYFNEITYIVRVCINYVSKKYIILKKEIEGHTTE